MEIKPLINLNRTLLYFAGFADILTTRIALNLPNTHESNNLSPFGLPTMADLRNHGANNEADLMYLFLLTLSLITLKLGTKYFEFENPQKIELNLIRMSNLFLLTAPIHNAILLANS